MLLAGSASKGEPVLPSDLHQVSFNCGCTTESPCPCPCHAEVLPGPDCRCVSFRGASQCGETHEAMQHLLPSQCINFYLASICGRKLWNEQYRSCAELSDACEPVPLLKLCMQCQPARLHSRCLNICPRSSIRPPMMLTVVLLGLPQEKLPCL